MMAAAVVAVALAAQVSVAIPGSPVPQSLQTLAVVLVGAWLGPVRGGAALILYVAIGAVGAPVFADGAAGAAHLSGPTSGYLAGFVVEENLDELAELARSTGMAVVGRSLQYRRAPDGRTLIGRGKVEEIARAAEELGADVVIFDDNLTPNQIRNLEEIIACAVIDRSALILDLFVRRARTREARTQVELAQLEYQLPRLTGRWTHLSRQVGGIGVRGGEGETQLEVLPATPTLGSRHFLTALLMRMFELRTSCSPLSTRGFARVSSEMRQQSSSLTPLDLFASSRIIWWFRFAARSKKLATRISFFISSIETIPSGTSKWN